MTPSWSLVCGLCGAASPNQEAAACGACGGPSVVRYEPHAGSRVDETASGIWRYRAWLPLAAGDRTVSLGEGHTPLVRLDRWARQFGLEQVYAKLEYAGPTGSFKDRGAAMLVSHALSLGIGSIVEDSSGNAGAAIAAYSARAGLECRIFAPATAPPAKLRQARAYGAGLTRIEGSRRDVEQAARTAALAADVYYAGHNDNPYFVEGTKTFAFELAEAFEGRRPDHVVLPVGGGSLFVGAALGFRQRLGARPRLHLAQASACAPLVAAFRAGSEQPLPVQRTRTVAGGIEIESPARGALILRLLRESGGTAVAVEEEEILRAQRQLASMEGVFMEPTSAAAFAGLSRLAAAGVVRSDERIVVAVTGAGLKDAEIVDAW